MLGSTLASQNVLLPTLLQSHLFSNSWIARDQRSVVVLEMKTKMVGEITTPLKTNIKSHLKNQRSKFARDL